MRGWKSPILVIPLDPPDQQNGRVALKPFVEEACAALGFLQIERVGYLCDAIAKAENYPAKAIARDLIKDLCPDRPKGSRAPLDLSMVLTEAGNADPRYALEQTIDRAIFNRSRARHILEFGRVAKSIVIRLELCANRNCGCAASLAMDGRKFASLDDLPLFPLPGCDKSVCRCMIFGEPVIPG
jgi:hypothetical protein